MDPLPDIPSMKVAELKKELKARGLTTTGNKNELIERLQLAVAPDNTEEDDSDLLAEASELLEDDNGVSNADEPTLAAAAEEPAPQPQKVAIKRDAVVPAAADSATTAKTESGPAKEKETVKITAPTTESMTTPKGKQKIIFSDSSTSTKITVLGASPKPVAAEEQSTRETSAEDENTPKPVTDEDRAAARAARFGITSPSTEDDKKSARAARFVLSNKKNGKIGDSPSVDLETLKKRAERFGQASDSLKSAELKEQIKKRQERFGAVEAGPAAKAKKIAINENLLVDEKLKKRAERFGNPEVKA